MELHLLRGFLVVLLVQLCQGQGPASPSPTPRSAMPNLGDVIDAVRAAFLQVVHELAPQENRTSDHLLFDTGLVAESTSASLVRQQVVKDAGEPDEELTELTNEDVELVQEPLGSVHEPDGSSKESMQGEEGPDLEEAHEESIQDLDRTALEDQTTPEEKSSRERNDTEQDGSLDHMELSLESEGGTLPSQASVESIKDQMTLDFEGEDGDNTVVEVDQIPQGAESQLSVVPEVASEDDSAWTVGVKVDLQEDEEPRLVVDGDVMESLMEKATKKSSQERVEVTAGEKRPAKAEETKEAVRTRGTFVERNFMDDITPETNSKIDVVPSRNPVPPPDVPTLGTEVRGLPAFPTLEGELQGELGETDELVEEPADQKQPASPKQEAWKIGVVAIAFFLVLQSLVTVVYILKCKRKRSSDTDPEKGCEAGIRRVQYDAANTDTSIPADDRSVVEDCTVQQGAALPMKSLHSDSTAPRL